MTNHIDGDSSMPIPSYESPHVFQILHNNDNDTLPIKSTWRFGYQVISEKNIVAMHTRFTKQCFIILQKQLDMLLDELDADKSGTIEFT